MTYKTLLTIITMTFAAVACSGGTQTYVYSCSVEAADGGSLITCPDGSQQVVLDGVDGTNGTDGIDGTNGQDADLPDSTVTEVIDPCGDGPGFDEVLLVLADGSIVAYFAGVGGFLAVLDCNQNYVTTDTQACMFRVNEVCEYEES